MNVYKIRRRDYIRVKTKDDDVPRSEPLGLILCKEEG